MDFPGGAVVKTTCRGLKIQSLVRELRSRMPHGAAKKKKKKRVPQCFRTFKPSQNCPVLALASLLVEYVCNSIIQRLHLLL